MRRFFTVFFCVILVSGANASDAKRNTFTGDYKNQLSFFAGQGIDSGFIIPAPTRFVPFYLFHMQYSQPTTFFGLPARQSLNIAETLGMGKKYGWEWDKYTIPMIFLSGDIALIDADWFYFAGGAGVGLQAQQNERLGAKLLFQFKLTAGFHLNDKWATEVFMHHFSNANTAPENYSYAFYGLGMTYNF